MKVIIILSLLLASIFPAQAEDELTLMLKKADELLHQPNNNDHSAARRLLAAILDKDPEHPQALWKTLYIDHIRSIENSHRLHYRATTLAAVATDVKNIIKQAKARDQAAYGHYVLARYAKLYNAFSRAVTAINRAAELEPDNVRYRYFQGNILAQQGVWEKRDELILKGIELIELARQLNRQDSDLGFNDADFYFQQGWYNNELDKPRHNKTLEYYQAVIALQPESKDDLAFAWNNSSGVYRKQGQCRLAKNAAEQALKVKQFGAAKSNLQYAEFCLEMETMTKDFKPANPP